MKPKNDNPEYIKVYDKRTKLFGIKIEGAREWYAEPWFEEIEMDICLPATPTVWFKKNGAYGLYDIAENRIVIPAEYGYPLFFNTQNNCTVTWKNYKAGVIDAEGNEVIPFIYDEIHERLQEVTLPEEKRHIVRNGKEIYIGPIGYVFHGYACFTNDGGEQVYDADGRPSEYGDWEKDRVNIVRKYTNEAVERMTLTELEDWIKKEFGKLMDLGYGPNDGNGGHRNKIEKQEKKVVSLLYDRRRMMNREWEHNPENARRIKRTNDLLMAAVQKGIKLGDKTARSLQWMEKVPNKCHYNVEVTIHPMWQNSKSDLRYERKYSSSAKENARLLDEEFEESDTHVWNIIAALGHGVKYDDVAVCFEQIFSKYKKGEWNLRDMTYDDGHTWDEYLHYPAYQDVYFTNPFNELCDLFSYSFEDLCNINDFRVNVNVRLKTREQGKKR